MSIIVCGSLAYDTLLTFPDRFARHLLPDQLHKLSVCFLVPELRREYGGCAGNIAYNLALLGGEPASDGTTRSPAGLPAAAAVLGPLALEQPVDGGEHGGLPCA